MKTVVVSFAEDGLCKKKEEMNVFEKGEEKCMRGTEKCLLWQECVWKSAVLRKNSLRRKFSKNSEFPRKCVSGRSEILK